MAERTDTTSLEGENESPDTTISTGPVSLEGAPNPPEAPVVPTYTPKKSFASRLTIPLLVLLIIGLPAIVVFAIFSRTQRMTLAQDSAFRPQQIDLKSLNLASSPTNNDSASTLTVNGQLSVVGSLQVNPGAKPTNPTAGQMYYDKSSNRLGYYNGSGFVYLQGGGSSTTVNNTSVTNTTVVNNYSTPAAPAPPSVLLQGSTPGTAQTGNFNMSGTGTMDIGDITTGNITTGNINTINGTTGNITTVNSDTGNIGLVNTTQVDSGGSAFYINKFSSIVVPAGQPVTAGYTTENTTSSNSGYGIHASKITTGSVGGPLQSISVYVNSW